MHPVRLPLLLPVLLVACTGSHVPNDAERSDSAGAEIVAYASLTPSGSLEVASEPDLWIQGDERIAPFDRISAMAVLGDGSVLVADEGAAQVHAFSADGSYLWSAGRSGDGPGEFRQVETLFVTPQDTILAVDARSRRITVLAPTGLYVRDQRFPEEIGEPVTMLKGGTVLYLGQKGADDPGVGVHHSVATWSAVDSEGASPRAVLTTAGHDSYHGVASGMSIVIRPSFLRHAYAVPLDSGFAVALSDVGRIDEYDSDGRLLRSIRVPEAVLSSAITDPEAVREGLLDGVPPPMQEGFRELVQDLPIPAGWPPIGGMIAADADRLWVQEYRASRNAPIRWHVFDVDGSYVDEVTTPAHFTPQVIRGGLIAGVWRDDLDVQSVRLYRIRGR